MNTRLTPENIRAILCSIVKATHRSQYGNGVGLYAFSLLDSWQDRLRYRKSNELPALDLMPSTAYALPDILRQGYKTWHNYAAACGYGVLSDPHAIACRLYGREKADKLDDDFYLTDAATRAEGVALSRACDIITAAASIIENMERP